MKRSNYSSLNSLRSPLLFYKEMLGDLRESFHIAYQLAKRNIKTSYKNSLLGVTALLLPPIASTILFFWIAEAHIIATEHTGNYTLFVFINTCIWQSFAESLWGTIKQTVSLKLMLTRINFPREALVLASIAEATFTLLLRGALIFLVLLYFNQTIPVTFLLAFPVAFITILLGSLLGALLTPLAVLVSDFQKVLTFLLSGLFLLTPIGYALPKAGTLSEINTFNPLYYLISSTRELILGQELSHSHQLSIVFIVIAITLAASWIVIRVSLPFVQERMGA